MIRHALLLAATLLATSLSAAPEETRDYRDHPEFAAFAEKMQAEHGYTAAELDVLFTNVTRQQKILDAISSPAEGKDWHEYRPIFITDARIEAGRKFWNEHEALLARAEREFGVDREIIVAIIGVETYYGRITGSWRVIDALSTLGFDYPPRMNFFRSELEEFLLLVREEDIDTSTVSGSYAGAMGGGQFIPSSYRMYAVDFDKDGKRDLWNSWPDVIGSVANYLSRHRWHDNEPVAVPAAAGDDAQGLPREQGMTITTAAELRNKGLVFSRDISGDTEVRLVALQLEDELVYWLGLHNFGVINRYNRSPLYAMAVMELATAIERARR
ncbi:MAG: lytic murein transglycosylase B [Gammaproteobacteria bacterium]|nr:lytic murein transglycosylase B [Gammaproteobacteria bacterium]